ncbi:MAG TPA: hypothetical protein VJT67_11360 [Longimicrobiaceae bacterium]|nr:hypothetical protein [Longimicrobiaceae bacterium]
MSFSQLRPLSIGEVLDGAFTIYRRQFASMFLTALVPQIPMIALLTLYYGVLGSLAGAGAAGSEPSMAALFAMGVGAVILVPAAVIGNATAVGAITFQTARAYTGAPVTTREAIRRGLDRALPLVGAYMVVGFLAFLGFFALIVGMFVVLLGAFAVAPAVVLERRGPVEAMSRSWALVKGAWGEVFLVAVLAYLIAMLPGMAVGMVTTIGGLLLSHGDPSLIMASQAVGQVLSQVARTLTIPFSLGATVLLYYDRRVRTEALDVQMMAESLAAAPRVETPAPSWG